MLLSFRQRAWEDYLYWFATDRKTCKRIHTLIAAAQRQPFDGIGKPEPLKGNLQGLWSRRIDQKHRMIYAATQEKLIIAQLRHHY
ncbi:MAG: Txe/YoeB family addiction module toxin [Cyanobacteria bacterium J06639_16]